MLHADEAPFVALRPIYTLETAVVNPTIVGVWTNFFTFRIEPDGKAGYKVTDPGDGQEYAKFHLLQFGGDTIADVVFGEFQFVTPRIPVHCFARVHVDGNTLRLDWLGSERLAEQIERTGWPRHELLRVEGEDQDILLLTASPAELQQFVAECLERPEGFAETDEFERSGPKVTASDVSLRSWSESSDRIPAESCQPVRPIFRAEIPRRSGAALRQAEQTEPVPRSRRPDGAKQKRRQS
jgi:hypothetical protein